MAFDIKTVASGVGTAYATAGSYARAVDRDPLTGRLWAAYNLNMNRIRVAYSDDEGTSWTIEDPTNGSTITGYYQALAVDGAGIPHVYYVEQTGSPAYYNHYHNARVGGAWGVPSLILSGSRPIGNVNNAYAGDGSIHFVFSNDWTVSPASRLTYAKFTNDTQDIQEQVYGSDTYDVMACAVAVDSGGVPHAVWSATNWSDEYNVYYSNRAGGSWAAPTLLLADPYDDADHVVQIAIDTSGHIHVLTQRHDDVSWDTYDWVQQLLYCCNDGAWSAWEEVATDGRRDSDYIAGTGLWVTASGVPYVAWGAYWADNTSHLNVYYCKREGGVWTAPISITPEDVHNLGVCSDPTEGLLIWTRVTGYEVKFLKLVEEVAESYAYFF